MKPTLIKKTRRPKGSGPSLIATRITAAEFYERHRHCVNMEDIYSMSARSKYMPGGKAVCDHEEDGYCFHNEPTPEILEKINARLGGNKPEEVEMKRNIVNIKQKKYFCLKCKANHIELMEDAVGGIYVTHLKFKRGRGRPAKK
jgi:hypothetical protein